MSALNIFGADLIDKQSSVYDVTLQVRHTLVGGVPSDESVIRGWLRSRLDASDKALEELLAQTLKDRFADQTPTIDQQLDALVESTNVNGFVRNSDGFICLEGRCLKAGLKEASNSAFPGNTWDGKRETDPTISARKGLMSTMVERVFVPENKVVLLDAQGQPFTAPSRVEERIKQVKTPQGPKSAISRVEVMEAPMLQFTVKVHDDFMEQEAWGRIWARLEDIGIGADRARGDGQFDLVRWERRGGPLERRVKATATKAPAAKKGAADLASV